MSLVPPHPITPPPRKQCAVIRCLLQGKLLAAGAELTFCGLRLWIAAVILNRRIKSRDQLIKWLYGEQILNSPVQKITAARINCGCLGLYVCGAREDFEFTLEAARRLIRQRTKR